MTVIVCMDEAGTIWIANGQGDMLAECFSRRRMRPGAELRLMGYHRLLTVYPQAYLAAGAALIPPSWARSFWRAAGRLE